MYQLIALSRAFHFRHLTAEEFRRSFIDAISAMNVDDVMSVALFFADCETDNDERDYDELIKQ
jgi:hypothetical protein